MINEFINNVYCRRVNNQHKAQKIWTQLKAKLPDKIAQEFEIEWQHYLLSEFSSDEFSVHIDKIKEYL